MDAFVFYMGIAATLLLISGFGFTMYEFSQLTVEENGPEKPDRTIEVIEIEKPNNQ